MAKHDPYLLYKNRSIIIQNGILINGVVIIPVINESGGAPATILSDVRADFCSFESSYPICDVAPPR